MTAFITDEQLHALRGMLFLGAQEKIITQIEHDFINRPLVHPTFLPELQGNPEAIAPLERIYAVYPDEVLKNFITSLKGGVAPATPTPTPAPVPPAGSGNAQPPVAGITLPLRAPDGTVSRREARSVKSVELTDSVIASMELEAQIFTTPVAFLREVAFGGSPLVGHPVVLRQGGEIVCLETVAAENTQEKSEQTRAGSFHLNPYDGGMGMVQGGFWHNGVLHRARPDVNMVKLDSRGELSLNFEDYFEGKVERGQAFVIHVDRERRKYVLSFRRAGWGLEIAGNTDSGNDHNSNLDDRRIPLIEPTPAVRNVDDLRTD